RFRRTKDFVDPAAPDEQRVTQSIEIADGLGGHGLFAGKRNQQPLGAAADGPANMKLGIEAAASGQDERSKRLQFLVRRIQFRFELGNIGGCNARLLRMYIRGQRSENGTEVEQLMLDPFEYGRKGCKAGLLRAEL